MGDNEPVTPGKKRMQQITVGILVGLVIVSLALTLVGGALAAAPEGASPAAKAVALAADEPSTTPSVPAIGSTGDPKPVTKTPQGTSTQVTDDEHVGGLIGYLVLMLGGVLLLVRTKRRERRERAAAGRSEAILSRP
ncbi:hypothetical protein OO014_05010 [Intrasporangium calvum]|uniref:LPXTG cell wall anchor domain-containing protein n=1 Tax=Intrasporangium calvum TaxID=53358 RepID=A0ABT5GED7_9MICO|nr:hypothetical protein [Intrasporangium calvum]MDC5696608.1 hypothetical protein [Intrasporangium calvum]